jgi:hypothetical protein
VGSGTERLSCTSSCTVHDSPGGVTARSLSCVIPLRWTVSNLIVFERS